MLRSGGERKRERKKISLRAASRRIAFPLVAIVLSGACFFFSSQAQDDVGTHFAPRARCLLSQCLSLSLTVDTHKHTHSLSFAKFYQCAIKSWSLQSSSHRSHVVRRLYIE